MFQPDQTVTGHRTTQPPGVDTIEVGPGGDTIELDGRTYIWDEVWGRYIHQDGDWNWFLYHGSGGYELYESQDPPLGTGTRMHTGSGTHDGRN